MASDTTLLTVFMTSLRNAVYVIRQPAKIQPKILRGLEPLWSYLGKRYPISSELSGALWEPSLLSAPFGGKGRSWSLPRKKTPDGIKSTKIFQAPLATLTLTMLISNRSSRPNAVLRYEANIILKDGSKNKLQVEQGQWKQSTGTETITLHQFGVIPFNVPPFSTVEGVLCFLNIDLEKHRYPIELAISVVDMYGKRFTGTARLQM
jgi:hypothetical protein